MRRSTGPSPFTLSSVEERDRQKTHKRKRSNDDIEEQNKRTKTDKNTPANNNAPATSKSVETVDLAASEKGGNPEETNSAQNSPAAVKPLLTLPALSAIEIHLDTDLHKIEQDYKQALERAKETQKNERLRLCDQMERELKEKEQEYKDLLKKWDMQVSCGICYDQFLRSQIQDLKYFPCHLKSHYCLSCYCKMFKVSAYGHSYRLWIECPLCRSKWWTDVQTFNDHNGVREGSSVQTLPGPLSPFTARDVPASNLTGIAQFFSQYRSARPVSRQRNNRFVLDDDEDEEQDEENTGDSESDLLHTFAQSLHDTLNDRTSSNNATNAANDNHTVVNNPALAGNVGHAGINYTPSAPRAIRPANDYRVVDFFPWDQQTSSSAASPYVISDLDDDSNDDDDDDDNEIGYAGVYPNYNLG
eukprot:TRINITY_DN1309_c0_g1_i1.p1 TRINITY_DN1309_c0_g1~~TRINITY_DN1309_c0_g1_i1.p1  ORF type:complete len:416 (-),score=78.43 TRINITY_DN1309_c0_g1_i1:55-1302(-)